MSDPLTNLEIQDVLSSIRRLVSEDNRHRAERERGRDGARGATDAAPADAPVASPVDARADSPAGSRADSPVNAPVDTAAEAPAEMRVEAPAEPGKLFLTEALRVVAPVVARAWPGGVPEGEEPASRVEKDLSGTAADARADATARAAEEAAAEAAVETRPIDLDLSVTGDARFEAEDALPAVAEAEAAGGDTWEPVEDAASLEGTIAGLEAAVAGIGGEFEPDGSEVVRGAAIDAELEEAFEEGFPVDAGDENDIAMLSQPVTAASPFRAAVGAAVGAWPRDAGREDADAMPGAMADAMPVARDARAAHDAAAATGVTVQDAAAEDGAAQLAGGASLAVDHFDLAAPDVGTDAGAGRETGGAGQDGDAADDADGDRVGQEDGDADRESDAAAGGMMPAFVHTRPARVFAGGETGDGATRASAMRRLTLTAAEAVTQGSAPWDRADAPPLFPDADSVPGEAPGLASELADDADAPAAAGDDEGSIFGPGDAGVIDMDMLRDLVAEIIREELQGPLGERITRNVRMLVRREINRALEGRGLE